MNSIFIWGFYIVGLLGVWFGSDESKIAAFLTVVICACTLAIIDTIKEK